MGIISIIFSYNVILNTYIRNLRVGIRMIRFYNLNFTLKPNHFLYQTSMKSKNSNILL